MADALIIDAVRSAIGRRNGTLAAVRADDLAADVLNGLVGRVGIDTAEIEDVQMGGVTQVGEQAVQVGGIASLVAGWPETVAATTVDRQCGSSMQAAFNASAAIQAGHLDVVVAAGVESMSRAIAAIDGGKFEQEIVPVTLPDGGTFEVDEAPRRDTSADRLAELK